VVRAQEGPPGRESRIAGGKRRCSGLGGVHQGRWYRDPLTWQRPLGPRRTRRP
jgi:hypothetical protein